MATTKELSGGGGVEGKNTVIGPSILISGKLTGDEDLTVQGRVEGELTLTRTLIVEQNGIVKANVAVKNAIVSGVVVGNINATESVELTHEGRMVGDIRAPRVIIVDGASFRGRVDMGEVEPGRINTERPVLRPTVRPAIATVPARPSIAPLRPPPAPVARAADVRPRPPAVSGAKPAPPSPPPPPPAKVGESKAEPKVEPAGAGAPPAPPSVAAGGKKKVIIKKKAR